MTFIHENGKTVKTLIFCLAQTLDRNGLWYSDIETIEREYLSHNIVTDF